MDQSFVFKVVDDDRSLMIVQTTTQMAHALGMRLVAEGVEDADTAAELLTLGVDVFQGYHIAEPMPADEVASWVRRWSAPRAVGAPGSDSRGGSGADRSGDLPGWPLDLPPR